MTSRPGTLRSCRVRSVRLMLDCCISGCCASAKCGAEALATISTAAARIRVVLMWNILSRLRWETTLISGCSAGERHGCRTEGGRDPVVRIHQADRDRQVGELLLAKCRGRRIVRAVRHTPVAE